MRQVERLFLAPLFVLALVPAPSAWAGSPSSASGGRAVTSAPASPPQVAPPSDQGKFVQLLTSQSKGPSATEPQATPAKVQSDPAPQSNASASQAKGSPQTGASTGSVQTAPAPGVSSVDSKPVVVPALPDDSSTKSSGKSPQQVPQTPAQNNTPPPGLTGTLGDLSPLKDDIEVFKREIHKDKKDHKPDHKPHKPPATHSK
jgi:hypothetical protein